MPMLGLTNSKIVDRQDLTHDVFQLTLETDEPVEFKAGQFITLKCDDRMPPAFRAYSIASAPEGKNTLELCIKLVPNGRGTTWLNDQSIETEIPFLGPNGHFVNQTDKSKKILFVATGTGLAPFRSIVQDELNRGNTQEMKILFGVRHEKDIFYEDWLKETAENFDNFSYKITLSRPETTDWSGSKGRVTAALDNMDIDLENTEVYICGLNAMITNVTEILLKKGLPQSAIHSEKYD